MTPTPTAVLLERERERAALGAAIQRLEDGRGGVVAIGGPAGIGKSSLLEYVAALARQSSLGAVAARGSEHERGFAYGVVRQLFEPALRRVEAGERERLLSGAGELARSLLALPSPGVQRPGPGGDFELLNALCSLTSGLAEREPLLISVDDAQWADAPSLRFLGYLARRLEGIRALVCVALRPPQPAPDGGMLGPILAEARSSESYLEPQPLSEEGSATLARELLGDDPEPAFLDACHAATGGNPLLLRELCRGLVEGGVEPLEENVDAVEQIGSAAVSRSVELRLSQLPPEATALARSAAVLGHGAAVDEAAALADLPLERALDALDALCRQDIFRRQPELEFVHSLVRESITAAMAPGEAARARARAAEVLAEIGAPAERVAEQILDAPPAGEAGRVAMLRAAAAATLAAGNGEAAAAYLRRALREPPPDAERAALLTSLARAETLIDGPAAVAHMEEALSLTTDAVQRAEISLGLLALLPSLDPNSGVEVGRAAITELGSREPELCRRLEAMTLNLALLAGRPATELDELTPAWRASEGAEPSSRMLTCVIAYRRARENVPSAELIGDVRSAFGGEWVRYTEIAGAQYLLGLIVLIAADHPDVLALCDEWEAAGRRLGRIGAFSGGKMFRARALVTHGDLRGAAAAASEALEAMSAYRMGGSAIAYAAAALAEAQMGMGDLERAGRTLGEAVGQPSDLSTSNLHGLWLSRARLRALCGDTEAALGEMLDLGRRFEEVGGQNPALVPWRSGAALLAHQVGDRDRARTLADEEVELARAWGAPRTLGHALTAAATVGEDGDRIPRLEEAVEVLEASPARLTLAEAHLALGVTIRRLGSPSDAREPLSRALELASACGAAPLERQARDELLAVGARPRRSAISGPEALTSREHRVVELAADGYTNRQIAQELFLTKRTVEAHLTRAYRKLGISSRSQLPGVLPDRNGARLTGNGFPTD